MKDEYMWRLQKVIEQLDETDAELAECQRQRDALIANCIDFLEMADELGLAIDYAVCVEKMRATVLAMMKEEVTT